MGISEEEKNYLFRHMLQHMIDSKDENERKGVKVHLLDLDYIEKKLDHMNISDLIADYNLLIDEPDLQKVRGALQLSAHILAVDKSQLKSQLYGRLFSLRDSGAMDILNQIFLRD